MTLIEFQKEAIRTLPDLGSLLLNSIHMTLGMGSETYDELLTATENNDPVNIAEEIADAQWYMVNYATLYGIELPEVLPYYPTDDSQEILYMTAVAKLQDMDKKELCYGKKADPEERKKQLFLALQFLEYGAETHGINAAEARQKVINKLRYRYPEKFSQEHAINRNTEAERRILEQSI